LFTLLTVLSVWADIFAAPFSHEIPLILSVIYLKVQNL